MEEKKSYSIDEIKEMFEAYDRYVKEMKSIELVKYGIDLLKLYGYESEDQVSDVFLIKKSDIEKAISDCFEKIPKSLLRKLGIDKPDKDIEVIHPKPGERINL